MKNLAGAYHTPGNIHDDSYMKTLGYRFMDSMLPKERESHLKLYNSFMFTRHPFERIVSAYVEKFTKTTKYTQTFHHRHGCKMIRRFRPNATAESLKKCDDATFPEFVKYLIQSASTNEPFNTHWMPFYKICNPCTSQYSYIGKLETFEQDRQFILETFFGARNLTFPHSNSMHHGTTTTFLNQISEAEWQALYEIYRLDFELFGYSP